MIFYRLLQHLRDVAENGQPGRGDKVLIDRRALHELLDDYDRLDAQMRKYVPEEFQS